MPRPIHFRFRLYVAQDTPNSAIALANLMTLCKVHLLDRYSIEVVDVVSQPGRALADGIRMTPTLVRLSPAPRKAIVGTLSHTDRVLVALGIVAAAA